MEGSVEKKQMGLVTSMIGELNKAIDDAHNLVTQLRKSLEPVIFDVNEKEKVQPDAPGEKYVPLSRTIELSANKVHDLVERLKDLKEEINI